MKSSMSHFALRFNVCVNEPKIVVSFWNNETIFGC